MIDLAALRRWIHDLDQPDAIISKTSLVAIERELSAGRVAMGAVGASVGVGQVTVELLGAGVSAGYQAPAGATAG